MAITTNNTRMLDGNIDLTSQVTSVLPTANGGTGHSTPVVAYVNATSNQTLTNEQYNDITLDNEVLDTANAFTNNQFTPPVAGYYHIVASTQALCTDDNDLTALFVRIAKAGVGLAETARGHAETDNLGGANTSLSQSAVDSITCLYLTPSDTIKMQVYVNSGAGTVNTVASRTSLNIFKIA